MAMLYEGDLVVDYKSIDIMVNIVRDAEIRLLSVMWNRHMY